MNEQTSRRTTIFDGFVAVCQKDLGPLCTDWVEQLTLLAPSYQPKEFKDDTSRGTSSSISDTYFKTPWQKQTRNSQLASTPTIFHGLGLTPSIGAKGNHQSRSERENGSCSTIVQTTIPLGTTSVLQGKEILSPSFDKSLLETPVLLHNTSRTPQDTSNPDNGFFTPCHPSEVTPKHISESLGAKFDSDMSWSSSLATPPSLSPTVIICKAEEKDLPQFKPLDVHVPMLVRDRVNVNHTHALPLIEEEKNGYVTVVDNSCRLNNRPECLPNDSKGFEDERLCSSEVPWNQTVLELPKDTELQLPIDRVLNKADNVSSMFFTDSPLSEPRKAISCTENGEKYSIVRNIQSNNIESLESASIDEKGCFESMAAKSSSNIIFDHLNVSSVQDITTSVLMNEMFFDKCQKTDVYSQDKNLGKDLSTSNASSSSSSSDWSQLNFSELDESHMIESSDIVTSTTEICLGNAGITLLSSETNRNQPQDYVPAKFIDKGLYWKKNGPSESSASCYFAAEVEDSSFKPNIISFDSTKRSETEVKCTTLKPACRRTPETPLISSLTVPELIQIQPLNETHMDSNSQTVLTRPSPIGKNEELQLKCVAECRVDSTKLVNLLCHQVNIEDPTNSHQNVSNMHAVFSTRLTNKICSVMDPDITKDVSLEDSEKCQLDEKDQNSLLCSMKKRSRKFLYFVPDSSTHQEQNNINLDRTIVQNRKPVPPSELLNSSKKSSAHTPAKPYSSVTGFTTSTYYKGREAVTDPECVPCVFLSDQLCETNESVGDGNVNLPSHVTVRTNHQLPNESRGVEDRLANDKKWDNFVTPLNSRPVTRRIHRRVRSTACRTVAKRLSLESEVKLANHFHDKTEVNTVQSEVLNVNEKQILQNKGRSGFQFALEPISNINQSLTSYDCSETKLQGEPNNQDRLGNCGASIPAQLSTKQQVCTSVRLPSPKTCLSDSLSKCKEPISDIENCKTNLKKNEMDTSVEPLLKSVEESKLFENMEPLSPCFNKEKHLEEICFVTKEIPSHDKTPDTCILVDNEKAECSVKSAGSRIGRKIGILASTLRTTNLITEIGTDPLLPSSGTLSVQSVPESKLEFMENNFGIVKKMYGSGYSSKSDLDTAVVSSSTKETKLYERFDAEKLSDFTAIEEESLSRMKWKSQCDEDESGSVTARGTEIVSGNIEIPLVSEHYGFCNTESKFNGFKTASEKHIKISAENLSKGKLLFSEIENMILEVINTQDTTIEHIPAQNRDTIQETESTNSSDETGNKINFKVPVGVIHKSLPHVFINTQTNNSSAVISEPKLFGQDACLTASQTADVAELFSMLEDTGSQTEFTQFRKKSPIDCTIKDDKLLVEASAPSLTPIWSEWKDVDFDENFEIESSLPLNSKPCISQQRAGNRVLTEISKCLKVIKNRSESNQQIAEKIKQIKSNDCGDSFDSSNKTKPCTASLIPNSCMSDLEIDSNTDKKELVTKLNLAVLPPKMNAACTNIHGGFCTANGSKIKLSSESLKKSADIFREIDHDQGQTSSETISNRHLGYLHDSSTMENEKVAEDKLGDVTKILTSKTYHECAAIHLPVNNTNIPSPILRNRLQIESKIVGNNRQKSAIQIESKLVTVSKEILDRAKSLIAEENLLHESENKKSGSPCSMKESTCMPQNTLSVCSGTKNTVNKELVRNEVESTGGNLCSTSVVDINPAFEIEDANGIECFWETSSKRFRDSVEYLDKAKLFDNEECCGNLPNTKTISEQVHVDEFQKILVNCQSAVKNVGSNVEFYEQPGNVKAALNVPICAVSATASMNSISVDSGIFIKESQVSGKKELPSPVEQVHLPDVTDTEMRGFQTASGKIVSICRASLTKAKTFFAEEDLPMNAPETFSTAVPAPHVDAQFIDNTVKNTATEQEPDKSKISGSLSSYIKQDDFAITGKVCEDPTAEPRFQVLTGYPIGFSTASGKSLQVSEELLRKCKQLFSEIEGNKDDFEKILEKDLKPELAKTKSSGENFSLDTNVSFGFNTASGKKVIVSNGARQKAKSMLKEFDDMNDGPLGSLEYPKGKIYEKTQELVSPEAALYMSGCQACRSSTGPIQQCTSKNCSDRVSAVCDDFHVEANGSIINNAELNTGPSKPLSASELNSKICMLGFETAKRKEVIVEESNISVARSFLASKEERTADLTTGEKDGVASGGSSNCDKVSVSVEGCYVLKNDLDAHSTMLENYIENEALESAKALLDDGLFGSTTDQEVPSDLKSMNQSIDKSEFKLGKRLRSEEKLEKEGPPPKRKLLADFDRSMQNDYKSAFRSSTGNLEVATGESTSVDSGAMMKVRQVFDNEELLSANCYPIQQEPQLDDSVTGMKGFQTASGKIVSVCKVSLAKAKAFFAEADLSMNVPETFSTTVPPPHIGTQFIDDTIKNTTTGQNNEPDKSKISGSFSNHLNLTKQDDFAITSKVWEGTASEPPCQALTEHIGFSTASGKSVQVSEESLRECKKLFSEIEGNKEDFQRTLEKDSVPEQTKRKTLGQTYHSDTASTNISFGFNTASGKRVPVSNDALQKAKFKLKEFDDMNDGSLGSLEYPEGKIYEKTRALVSESSLSTADDPSLNGHPTCTKRSTSQKSLPKNSSERFSDLPDDFQEEANGSKINDVEVNPGLSKPLPANGLNSKICMFGFQTAHGKDVLVEESNLAAARSFLASEKESTAGENVGVAGDRSSNCNADSVSVLRSHALKNDLDAHSKILENYIENEMLESAKALLEDDPFDSTSDYGVQSNVESMNQSDRSKLRMGKRLRSEEKLAKEGLPPKRQLLAYFDRTIQNVHKPRFKSSITNPEGIFCDRRKFTYNVPLKPLICDPSKGNSTSSLIHQQLISPNVTFPIQENQNKNDLWFHHKTKSLNGQDPVFVASFQKHSVGCVQPYNSKQRTSKSTKMFVPPFKTGSNAPQTEQFENTNITLSKKSENEIIMKNNFDQSKHSHEGSALKNDRLENKPKPISNNSEHHGIIVEGSVQMVHNLQCARDLQEMRLIKKRRQTIRPEPGSLYRTKHSGAARKSLHTAVEGMFPVSRRGGKLYVYGISRSTLSLQGANAESFCINCREFFSEELMMAGNGIQLADGEWLIPDHSGMAGKSAFHRALLDTPGVDPKLITEAWTYNHYKWIVWKLAAMETAFPKQFGSRCLTPEMILLQLKYRYDVEIDKSRRSALRKIMERDDTSTKTLILCVSKIISMGIKCLQNGHNASDDTVKQSKEENEKSVLEANDLPVGVIEVTDGWYGIKVILDRPLTALLQKKRLVVGQKIVVHGAELIGSQDAYTPLEAPESLMMKISANSTRRARWYAKLGFHYDPRPFPLPLSSLFGEGGMVGCVDVIIQRTYPIQWMEKKCNGVCVFRNERAEEREAQIHCEKEQRKLEALCAKIEADLQEKYKMERKLKREHRMQRLNKQQIMKLQEGVELYEAIQNSLDPSSLEMCLNEQQLRTLNNYRQLLNEQKQSQIEVEFRKALESAQSDSGYPKRDVSPVWKLRIVDYKGQDNNAVYMLSIWRPVAELQSLLKEGKRYRIYHLNTSCCKSRFGGVDLQLTATKKTRYQQFQPSPEVLEKLYHPRQAVVYNMLYNPSFRTFCKEIDLVGYVIYITEKAGFAPMVYLANENQDLVVVKFWASLNQLVLEDTVKLGALIIASNLQWSSDSYMNVPKLFAGELSSFSANPKEALLRETYNELKSSVQFPKIFLKDAEEKVMALLKTINTPTSLRSSRDFGIDLRTPHTPIQRTPKFIPAKSSTELSLLDAESSPQTPLAAMDSGCKSMLGITKMVPTDSLSNLKKKGLSFLSRVPSPPRLSPLYNSVPQSVQKGFRPPRICITPQSSTKVKSKESSNVQTPSLSRAAISKMTEVNWIPDEELAMINTQDLCDNLVDNEINRQKIKREQTVNCKVPAVLLQNVKNDFHSDIELQNSSAAIESTNHLVASQSKRKCTEGTITLNTCEGVYQSEENVITQNHEYGGDEVQHQPGKLLLCRKKPQQRWKRKRY